MTLGPPADVFVSMYNRTTCTSFKYENVRVFALFRNRADCGTKSYFLTCKVQGRTKGRTRYQGVARWARSIQVLRAAECAEMDDKFDELYPNSNPGAKLRHLAAGQPDASMEHGPVLTAYPSVEDGTKTDTQCSNMNTQ